MVKCTACGKTNTVHFEDNKYNCYDCVVTFEAQCQIYTPNFKLTNEPAAIQLSVHINNILNTEHYGRDTSLSIIKAYLTNPENKRPMKGSINWRIRQLCEYYGIQFIRDWFSLVYSWSFKEAA